MPSVLILLAEGAEETEAVICVDVFMRGGVDVTLAGLAGKGPVTCSHNVVIVPDVDFDDAVHKKYDVIICPGGAKGAEHLCKSTKVGELLKKQESRGEYIACIGAGPTALKAHSIGCKKHVTSHPSVEQQMKEGYKYSSEDVVIDGKLITSQGPGTAFDFALKMLELLEGKEKACSVARQIIIKECKEK